MEAKNKKSFLRFCLYFILAIIVFWPFFVKAQELVLNLPSPGCTGSEAFVNLNWTSTISGTPTYDILRKVQGEATFTEIGSTQNLFYPDSPVASDKKSDYKIRAGAVESDPKTASAAYCPPVLSPPITSCAADGPRIALNWSPISGTPSIYEVYRDSVKIGQTSDVNFSDGLNIEGTKNYNYFIKAVWQNGTSRNSDTASIVALTCPPTLNASADCLNSAPGGPKVNLSWNNLIGVQNYQIYRKAQAETNFSLLQILTDTNYQDNLVESLPTYWQGGQISYYIKAVWLTDQKDSEQKQITILRCSPFLTVASLCSDIPPYPPKMILSWTETSGATNYNIYREGGFPGIKQVSGSEATFIDEDPCSGGFDCTKNYYVEALVAGLPNLPSNSVAKPIDCATVLPPSPPPILAAPETYCVSGGSIIKIFWTSSDNVIYYYIYRNGVPITPWLQVLFEDSAIQSGIVYAYYINAMGTGGSSAISDSQTITAVDCVPPSTPTLSLSTGCENGQPFINLSWTATTNTLSYEIYRGPSVTNFALLTTLDKSVLSWKDTGISSSTSYYYKVIAKGPSGVSSTSSDIKAIISQSCLPTTPSLFLTPACEVGNSVVNLSWVTDEVNTTRYEIFRNPPFPGVDRIYINDPQVKTWTDTSVSPETTYNYKVEAVGPSGRSTQGYKSITTYNCSPPGSFTLNEPNIYCQGSSPRADISGTASAYATSYNIYRYRLNPDDTVAETTTFLNIITSPFTDRGFGNALSFDGYYDYVNIPNSDSLNPSRITMEAWIYPTDFNYYGNIINKRGPEQYFLRLYDYTGQVEGYIYSDYGWRFCTTPSNIAVSVNKLNHVLFSYDGTVGKVYVNGQLGCSFSYTGNIASGTNSLKIGTYSTGSTSYERFEGIIDEVRIYNRALTATEISDHSKGIYSDAADSTLVSLWHFDEGSGQSASDSSNYGNDGRLGSTTGVNTSDPTWVQNGLQSETKYKWQAKAISPGGETFSNTTSPTLIPICLPTKPGLVLTSFCETGTNLPAVNLKWSYTTATTKYEIYRQDKGLIKTINQGDAEFFSRTWTDNNGGVGLTGGTNYIYYIRAIGPTNLSNQSDSISVIAPDCLTPTKPENLTANFECVGSYPRVKITWQDSQNATSYTIYRDENGSILTFGPIVDNNSPVYAYYNVYPSVKVNTAYTYTVKAFSPGGESPFSDPASIPAGNFCTPSVPSISFLITECESSSPINNLYWFDDTSFNNSAYKIYRNTIGTLPTEADLIKTITSVMPEFSTRIWEDNSGLSGKTTYNYWVKSVGPIGESSLSNSKVIATHFCGIPPISSLSLVGEPFCKDNLPYATLSWTTNSDATSYNLYRTNPDASSSTYSTRISPLTDKGNFALKFDGVNDYVELPKGFYDPNYATFTFWVYQDSYKAGKAHIGGDWQLDPDKRGLDFLFVDSNRLRVELMVNGQWFDTPVNSVTWGKWFHIAVTADKDIGKVKVYINGTFIYDYSPTFPISTQSFPYRLGRRGAELKDEFWNGLIDEVRIYNRALSPTEISEHYQGIYKNETELRGAWHLDEGEEVTLLDSSGNGNNGKIAGPVPATGQIGGALEFGGLNGHVKVPDSASLDIMTYETWFNSKKWESVNLYSPTIFNKYTDSNNMFRIAFDNTASGKIGVSAKKGGIEIGRNGTTGVALNEWHHLVVVFTNPVKIYLDKIDITSATSNIWSRYSGDNNLYIGSRGDARYFNGLIDEVRIYNRTLSSAEITEHYDGIFSNETGLAGLWHFDEESGETAYDSSPFDNDGTLIKGAEWDVPSDAPASIFISALAGESLYKYYVKAIGVGTESGSSNEISFNTPSCQPATPVLVVTAGCDFTADPPDPQLKLSWQADQNTIYWTIHKKREGKSWDQSPFPITTTNVYYLDGNVESDIDYTYYVTAWGKGVQENSDLITKTVPTYCNSPSNPVFIPTGDVTPQCYGYSSRILAYWKWDPTGNTVSFNVWRKNITQGETDFSMLPAGTGLPAAVTQYLDFENIVVGNIYQYKIEAVGTGEGNTVFSDPPSNPAISKACSVPPDPPQLSLGLVKSTFDLRTVTLHWTDAGPEKYYKVGRVGSELTEIRVPSEGDTPKEPADTYWVDSSSEVRTLDDYHLYQYKITAYNDYGSKDSNTINAQIPIAPPRGFDLSGSWVGNGVHLVWTKAESTDAGDLVTYNVWRGDSSTNFPTPICTVVCDLACDDILRKCEDTDSTILERFYVVIATNNSLDSTQSNIIEIAFPSPIWREIPPW